MHLSLFDLDDALYAYDFRRRLPRFAELSGVSQYRLAKLGWAAGRERRAKHSEWSIAAKYVEGAKSVGITAHGILSPEGIAVSAAFSDGFTKFQAAAR